MARWSPALLLFVGVAVARTADAQPSASEPDSARVFDLPSLIAAMVRASPDAELADVRARMESAELAEARSLPAPELAVEAWNIPFRRPYALDQAMMWMAVLRQPFEPRGLRDERRRIARERAVGREAEARQRVLAIAEEAADLHAQLAVRTEVLQARRAELEALERLLDATRTSMASGTTAVRDALAVEAAIAAAQAGLAEAEASRAAVMRTLDARLGLPLDTPIAVEGAPMELDVTALRASIDRHPELRVADAAREIASAEVGAARIEARRPRMTASVGVFEQPPAMPGMNRAIGYGLGFGLELPWIGGRAAAEERVAEADEAMREAELEGTRLRVRATLEAAIGEVDASRAAVAVYDERTLPALTRLAEANARGLASGATRIADVVEARRALAAARVERAERWGMRLRAEAALVALSLSLLEGRGGAP